MNKHTEYQLIIDSLLVLKHQGYTGLSTGEFTLFTALIDFVNGSLASSIDSNVQSTVKPSNGSPYVVPLVPESSLQTSLSIEEFDVSSNLSINDCDIQTMLLICQKNGDERQFTRLVQRWRALKDA